MTTPESIFDRAAQLEVLQEPDLLTLFKLYREADIRIAEIESREALLLVEKHPYSSLKADLHEMIDAGLKARGIEKGTLEGYAYKYTSSTKTVILDEEAIPESCFTPKVDAYKVKEYIKNLPPESDFDAAELQTTKSLQIKPQNKHENIN